MPSHLFIIHFISFAIFCFPHPLISQEPVPPGPSCTLKSQDRLHSWIQSPKPHSASCVYLRQRQTSFNYTNLSLLLCAMGTCSLHSGPNESPAQKADTMGGCMCVHVIMCVLLHTCAVYIDVCVNKYRHTCVCGYCTYICV